MRSFRSALSRPACLCAFSRKSRFTTDHPLPRREAFRGIPAARISAAQLVRDVPQDSLLTRSSFFNREMSFPTFPPCHLSRSERPDLIPVVTGIRRESSPPNRPRCAGDLQYGPRDPPRGAGINDRYDDDGEDADRPDDDLDLAIKRLNALTGVRRGRTWCRLARRVIDHHCCGVENSSCTVALSRG